jgi:hypothetical protein
MFGQAKWIPAFAGMTADRLRFRGDDGKTDGY